MNNDGKVDKSDFYLLNKRRKIKKAMKKENIENPNSLLSKANMIFEFFNMLTFLMDEGFLNNETLELNPNITLEIINENLTTEGFMVFNNIEDYNKFIEKTKNILNNF